MLSAGFGTRMRPLTDHTPKPLIKVAGKSLIDYALDALASVDVRTAIVNVHYLADQIEAHVADRTRPSVVISDERDAILETGGGICRALPLLKGESFFALNADTFWREGARPNLPAMAAYWTPVEMDALLLLAPLDRACGYAGRGDFQKDKNGRLSRFWRGEGTGEAYAFAGAAIYHHRLFENAPDGAFSMNVLFDDALSRGRLFGLVMDGLWLHVGTPDAIGDAERAMAAYDGG